MKDSCTRIVFLLCSILLLIVHPVISAETAVGPPFKFTLSQTLIPEGEIGCVDIVIEGFEDVLAFQLGFSFDSSIFRFDGGQSTALDPNEFFAGVATNAGGMEIITVGFAHFGTGVTLTDGTIAFSLCFESLGANGDLSSLAITDLANGNSPQINTPAGVFGQPDLCVVGADVIVGDILGAITVTATPTASTCQSSLDGAISLSILGGELPYSLLITDCNNGDIILGPEPAGNAVVVNSLNPGEYCIAITDNSVPSLVGSASVTVINGGPSLSARFEIEEPLCNGQSNGNIEAFPILNAVEQSNTTTDFSFIWTGPGITGQSVGPILMNVGAGSYDLMVTEVSSGCSVLQSIFLTQPAAIEVDIAVTNETCDTGGMDGTAAAVTTGGVGGYSFIWDDMNSSTDSLITGLGQGNYTVIVRDANDCPGTDTEMITAPEPPQIIGFDSVSISCPGIMDGSLTVNFMDGSSAVDRVEWIIPGGGTQTGATITGLDPGDYTVTVIAVDNCSSSMMVTLGPAAALEIDLVNTSTDPPACHDGGSDTFGALNLSVLGGVSPYTFNVNGEIFTMNVIGGRVPGVYDVFVIDANGCESEVVQLTIENPPPLSVEFSAITGVPCFGQPPFNGSATVTAFNGTGPVYNYLWASGENGLTSMNLMGGLQDFRLTSGDCVLDTFLTIPEPAEISVDVGITNVSCFGAEDGEIELTATGGTGMFTYETAANLNGSTLTDLSAGSYNIIIRDENDCAVVTNPQISQPDSLDAFILDVQNISCNGEADGLLIADFEGGTGTVSYQWDSGSLDTFSTNTTLAAGSYVLTVEDANGCTDTAQATIIEPIPIDATIPVPALAPCFGEQTNLEVTGASGGNGGPYFYTVNAGPTVPINSEIPVFAGEYTITVFDGIGCRETYEVTANEPSELQVQAGVDQEINLGSSTFIFGSIQSSIDIDSIFWVESPGDSTLTCYDCTNPTASPLDDSFYELFAVDVNGCVGSDEIFIKVDSDRNVYIPNVFSPNVDGFNDFFSPFTGVGVSQILAFTIYDRWGEIVFEKENFVSGSSEAGGWDGKMRGKAANPGVYFYVASIEFIDDVVLTYRGNVTLINNKEN